MKTQAKDKISMVERLATIIDERKSLEKEEKELKTSIKGLMGDESILEAGNHVVIIGHRSRQDIDKTKLTAEMGMPFVLKYTKVTEYEIVEVKEK